LQGKVITKVNYLIYSKTGNIISRKSKLFSTDAIITKGEVIIEEKAILRGDITEIHLGRYIYIGKEVIIQPTKKRIKKGNVVLPLKIGDCVVIEDCVVVKAVDIGSFVHIGRGAVLDSQCVISDCCKIEEGAHVPPNTVVPPFTYFRGVPHTLNEELPDSFQYTQQMFARDLYKSYVPQ